MPDKNDLYATVLAVLAIALWTTFTGRYTAKRRPTSDFLLASRTMGSRWNAAAVSGEYLSAASFLGIAGLVCKGGLDALWYPVGFTAGYLTLLLFVAAPLRRSGAYTLPDFAEVRLGSVGLRQVCSIFLVIIGWLYLIPQLRGAGLALHAVTAAPEWVGAAVVMVIVTVNVYAGWAHSITTVQALQYWIKLTALAVPVCILFLYYAGQHQRFEHALTASAPPSFAQATDVTPDHDVLLQVTEPIRVTVIRTPDGHPTNATMLLTPGENPVRKGTTLHFDAGSRVPVISGAVVNNDTWLHPLSYGRHPLLATYSLIVALTLGTMGLPQILGRYYTDPDGRAARQTTQLVLIQLGVFYLFAVVSGWLARFYLPRLLADGNTDAALLLLPRAMLGGWPALVLGALVMAGAFAAFVSVATGLVVSIAGVLYTDVLPGWFQGIRAATMTAWSVPLAFVLAVSSLDLAQSVGLAFAVAASSFCPLLVLGIWWRGLTDVGAAAGILVGGGVAFAAVLPAAAGVLPPGWQALLAQPAVFTVPLAFLVMVLVSRQTKDRVPPDASPMLLRLHAPDQLGLAQDRKLDHLRVEVGTLAVTSFQMGRTFAGTFSRMGRGRHRR